MTACFSPAVITPLRTWHAHSILVVMEVPVSTVRPHRAQPVMRFGDHIRQDGPSLIAVRAAGKRDLEGEHYTGQPVAVRIADLVRLSPHTEAVRFRWREVRVSTSIAVQPAIAASSSVGVKSVSLPVPNLSRPPWVLVAVNTP